MLKILDKDKKLHIALKIALSFIFAFQIFGFDLFLRQALWDTRPLRFFTYILCSFCVFILLCVLDGFLLRKKKKIATETDGNELKKTSAIQLFFTSFLALGTIWTFSILNFYPGNFTSDGVDQWCQALDKIYDYHPFINQVYLRVCSKIFGANPVWSLIVAAWGFSFVLARWAVWFSKKASSWKILLAEYLFAVSPSTLYMVSLLSKNNFFAVFFIWELFLLIKLFEKQDRQVLTPLQCFELIFVTVILTLIRHNGFFIIYLAIGALAFYCRKSSRKTKIFAIATSVLILASYWLMQNPVKYYFCKMKGGALHAVYTPLVTPYASAICSGVDLEQDQLSYLKKILPLDVYKKYNRYNSDALAWCKPRPNYSGITQKTALKYYLKLLFRHPLVVIKDRLDGTNLLWDFFAHKGVPNSRYNFSVYSPESLMPVLEKYPKVFMPSRKVDGKPIYITNEGGGRILAKWIALFNKIPILDALFWRAGIYVAAFLWGIYWLVRKRRYDALWIYSIPFAVFMTLLLVIGWQMYQYYWWLTISVPLLTAFSLSVQPNEV